MRCQWLVLSLIAGLSLGWGVLRAADPPATQEQIEQLVKQLGSPKFAERDRAKRDLEAIGAQALPALKLAVRGEDPEVSRRAAELLRTLEDKLTTAVFLAPKKVNLKITNRPVMEAIEELSKQSGYPIEVQGDRAELAGRKITLNTGEVSFWQAFDQLCAKANLSEVVPTNPYQDPNDVPFFGKKGKKGFKGGGFEIQPLKLKIDRILPAVPRNIDQLPVLPVVPPANPVPPRNDFDIQAGLDAVQVGNPAQPPAPMQPDLPAEIQELLDTLQKLERQIQPGQNPKDAQEKFAKDLREALDKMLQKQAQQLKLGVGGVVPRGGVAGAGGRAGQPGQPGAGGAGGGNGGAGGRAGLPGQAGAGGAGGGVGGPAGAPGQPGQPGVIQGRPAVVDQAPVPPPAPAVPLSPITVQSGKPEAYPTHYSGSVRIRALPASKARDVGLPPQKEGEVLVVLEVTPEPRLQSFQLAGAPRIDKALDDREQLLFPNLGDEPNANIARTIYWAPGPQKYIALRFKADKKTSNELKELAGAVTAQVSGETTDLLAIGDVLNAAGQSAKHPDGGRLEVLFVKKVGDEYRVRIRMDDNQVAGNNGNANANVIVNGNGVIIINGQVVGGNAGLPEPRLPSLVDAKGRPFQYIGNLSTGTQINNGNVSRLITMRFHGEESQGDPARLVISGSQQVMLQIPFTLENVPVGK